METLFVTTNLTDAVREGNFTIDAKSSFTAVRLAWFVKQSFQNLSMTGVMPVIRRISLVYWSIGFQFVISISALISQILDHEQEVCSTTGKSHVVIPAFTFYRDRTGDEDEKQGKRGNNTSFIYRNK